MSGGFSEFGLMPEVLRAIDELGWRLPTDIQDEAIPLILGGGDVMAAAETGSGKTAAFCLPIIQCVHERLKTALYDNVPSTSSSSFTVTLNPIDCDAELELDAASLSCKSSVPGVWAGARATHGVRGGGSYFYEATILGSGISRVGWSTMSAHLEVGKDAHGFGYGGKGFTSYSGNYDKYGEEYTAGDVIGCYLHLDSKTVAFSKNGKHLGKAYDIPEAMLGTVLFPAVLVQNSSLSVNFGAAPFRFPPSSGSVALSAANPRHLFDCNAKEAFMVTGKRKPLAIIIEPTRDLAEQVDTAIQELTRHVSEPRLVTALLIGDDPKAKQQERKLEAGVDIVVATIGKVTGLLKNKALDLSQVRFFVLDEADKLLNMENVDSVMRTFSHCPGGGSGEHRLQVCFFSATLHSPQIRQLAERICVNPTWVDLKGFESVPDTVHHVVYRVDPDRDLFFKDAAAFPAVSDEVHQSGEFSGADKRHPNKSLQSQHIKDIKPQLLVKLIDKFQMSQCMVFCRTNVDCSNLETFFSNYGGGRKFSGALEKGKENPYSCCVLAGLRSMDERRRNLQAFKDGDVRILICTDVAARGIDIEGLPYVINMTLPDESEDYIHRVGRVGRADRMGLAISFVASNGIEEKVWYHTCSSKGKSCSNRQLKENGGCTIWMDEAMQLAKVEKRLHMPIPVMEQDLELPVELSALNVKYGQDTKVVEIEVSPHFMQLGPTVRELASMEMMAQNNFLLLQQRFS